MTNEFIKSFGKERNVIVMGDMNAEVRNESVDEVVGKWRVPGSNENGEWKVDIWVERGLFSANTFCQHNMIHKYTVHGQEVYDMNKGADWLQGWG